MKVHFLSLAFIVSGFFLLQTNVCEVPNPIPKPAVKPCIPAARLSVVTNGKSTTTLFLRPPFGQVADINCLAKRAKLFSVLREAISVYFLANGIDHQFTREMASKD